MFTSAHPDSWLGSFWWPAKFCPAQPSPAYSPTQTFLGLSRVRVTSPAETSYIFVVTTTPNTLQWLVGVVFIHFFEEKTLLLRKKIILCIRDCATYMYKRYAIVTTLSRKVDPNRKVFKSSQTELWRNQMLGVRWRVAKFLSKSVLLETTNIPSSDLTAPLYAKRACAVRKRNKQEIYHVY